MVTPKHKAMSPLRHSPPATRPHARLRLVLLGGSALCGVAAVFVGVATRAANILPTQGPANLAVPTRAGTLTAKTLVGGVVTPGPIGYTSSGAAATVSLSAPRTLIDWTTFEVGAGNALTFNFINNSDIVLNRVAGGTISVDPGGAVNGTYGAGVTGGNLWFIAPNGVFLHGTVTASGVLATNNAALADANLLSDSVATLKGELAAAGSLFDLEGSVTATDASIDAAGNLILNGDVDAGSAGTVDLVSTGAITQTGGVITAASLTGSSVGATALTDGNLFDTLGAFANTGSGGISITDAQPTGLTVTGAVTVATGTTLSLTTTTGPLTVSASQTVSGGALNLSSATALAINAPVTLDGATAVSFFYNAESPTSLSFGNGASLTYANADGSPATASAGGSLSINGQVYTLLYNLALPGSTGPDTGLDDVAGIDANAAAGGDQGSYALAVNLAGTGTPMAPQFTSPLAGAGGNIFLGSFNGLGHTITNLTVNDASDDNVGLFGRSSGFMSNIGLVGGSLTANASANSDVPVFVGGLVGVNSGTVSEAYAGASVADDGGGAAGGIVGVGGLVGGNPGQITQSFATGAVADVGGGAAAVFVGGLAGTSGVAGSTTNGAITSAYATGSVTAQSGALAGGLVGYNNSAITQAYATGNVFNSGEIAAGLVGYNDTAGTVSAAAFDSLTTGQGLGIGENLNPDRASAASMTTSQLQTGGLPSGFDPTVWSGGTGGLYPFLTGFYPNGVQAVSGRVEGLIGRAAYSIGLIGGGTDIAVATAGANDTYYVIAPAGTLTSGESLLAYSIGAFAAAALLPATGATTEPGFNVYAPALTVPTSATTLSAAPTLAQAQTLALAVAGSNTVAQADIAGASGLGLLATGPSFTIDQPVTATTFGVLTGPGAPLTVAAPITMTGGGALGLLSGGALTIDAPVSFRGAGLVALTYDPSSPANLSFGATGSVTFANADGSPATSSQGGLLSINQQGYFLLYTLALPGSTGPDDGLEDIAGIDANRFAGGDAGDYALATNLTGTGSMANPQFLGPLAGQATGYFTGVFEGLGNTITNLTINNPTSGMSTGGEGTGLFGFSSGTIRDIGMVGGSVVGASNASVGEVAGANYGTVIGAYATGLASAGDNSNIGVVIGFNNGVVTLSSASGSASGGGTNGAIGGLVGGQTATGSISQSFSATAVSGGGTNSDIGGLVGNTNGSVSQSYATGTVNETGMNSVAGGLAGNNGGSISGSYATGTVNAAGGNIVGGLVGNNDSGATITLSYAMGTLTAGANSLAGGLAGYNGGVIVDAMARVAVEDSQSGSQLGGLVGYNDVGGSLTLTLASGPVNGDPSSDVGGLVGHNLGAIDNGLATGAVSGGHDTGGLVGHNDIAGTIAISAIDTLTTGQTNGIGVDSNPNGQSGNIEAATTTQLQTAGLPRGFDPDVWGGGTGGLYPYLFAFFPTGVQAVSGFAYSDAGLTPLASGVSGAVGVGVAGAGSFVGGAFTGANGYYYITGPTGSFSAGESLLVNTEPGAPGAATLSSATGDLNQPGLNLYGGAVTLATTAATLSTAPTLAQAQTLALAAAGSDTDAQNAIRAATGLGLILQGSTFTVDQPVTTSSTLVIETGVGALLAVDAPISLHPGASLGLLAGGELAIDAPIVANGGPIGVNLTYDTSQPTNLSFAAGDALTFANADGSVATSSQGGFLAVNGRAYTLLYNLAQSGSTGPDTGLDDIAGIDANVAAGGDAGFYALATDVAGTGSPSSPQFTSGLVGAGTRAFTGMFEGLGHTVTDLTISDSTNMYVGLFGGAFDATIRDMGLVGGSVNGRAAAAVGALVGDNEGLVVNTYSSAVVTDGRAFSDVGGLAGQNGGTILDSYATGAVTGGASGEAGGLVGDSGGSIIQAFATGAVTVGANGDAGGLLGAGDGAITQAYATGAVSGGPGAITGGLVGVVELAATVTSGAFDSVTTGQSNAFGSNSDPGGTSAVALTTAQFQSGNLPTGFNIDVWGSAPGLYPYLLNPFPDGVQAVSGIAFSDAGVTPLASGASGAVTVGLTANGAPFGTATTGANGYYYIFAPPGTISPGEALVAATIAGAPAESDTYTALGGAIQTGVNIYAAAPPTGLPTQGAVNLANPIGSGSLATNTLVGGLETPGTAGYASTGSTATVTLTASRTLIDWTTFEVGAGDTLNFDFTGSANDIVLNRVIGGTISVDGGGSVNGSYGGAPGGNVWFLASNGVFLHGAVAAGGVLASNNSGVADLNLLSDSLPTLKSVLAAGASLIDLTGGVSVTDAAIDGFGDIVLNGGIDTGPAGAVSLISTGTITQTGGVITTSTVSGSSLGGASLTDANQFATLAGFVNADSGAISLTDGQSLAITGAVDNTPVVRTAGVGRDIAIDVTSGNLTANAAIRAAGDIALQAASGSLAVSTLSSGDDVVLAAGQGAVSLGGPVSAVGTAAPGAARTLFQAISGPLDGLFTLGDQGLFIEARTFSNPAGSPLTAGNAIGISLSDPGGLNVADVDPRVGSWVRPAALLAPSVTLFEGVGNLNVATATIGGPITNLSLYAANFVRVTGVFAPSSADTVSLTIGSPTTAAWAPSEIDVVNDGGGSPNQGSIGYETIDGGTYSAAPLTFHAANLYATGDILMGSSDFVAANAAITGAALQLTNPDTPIPATASNTSQAILLAADNASLAAGSQIVQQNTAGLNTHNGVGTFITGALTLGGYGGSPPPAIDLFGAFVAGQGGVVTGQAAAASSQIVLSGALLSSPYRDLYRFNGCTIGLGGCLTGPSTTLSIVNNVANQGVLLSLADIGPPGDPQNADDASDSEASDDSAGGSGFGGGQNPANPVNVVKAGEAAFQANPFSTFGQRAIHPQINMSYVIRNGFLRFEDTDLEDLTITGAPNEEVWRKPEVRP